MKKYLFFYKKKAHELSKCVETIFMLRKFIDLVPCFLYFSYRITFHMQIFSFT